MASDELKALQEALASERQTKEIYRKAAAQTENIQVKQLFLQLARCNQNQQERLNDLISRVHGEPIFPGIESVPPVQGARPDEVEHLKVIHAVDFSDSDGPAERKKMPEGNGTIIPGLPDRVLIERLFDGVIYVDQDRKIRFWNFGAERITGYMSGDVIGTKCSELGFAYANVDGKSAAVRARPEDDVFETGLPKESRLLLTTRKGNHIAIDMLTTPIISGGRLIGVVEVFRDASAYQEMEEINRKLNDLAFKDALTGVPSRRWIIEQLNFEVKQVRRYQTGLWVGLLDVDEFKRINDRYGHFTGDMVLVEIAKRANAKFRDSDIFGRMGGDEFLFAFLNSMPKAEKILSTRVVDGFRNMGPPVLPEQVTVSIGMAAFRPDHDDQIESCIDRADRALYEAKRKGRNRLVLVS